MEDMAWAGRTDPAGRKVFEHLNPKTGKREWVGIPALRSQYGFHSVLVYQSKHQVKTICPMSNILPMSERNSQSKPLGGLPLSHM